MRRAPEDVERRRHREPGARQYPALDGLRALAIAGVVWHHCLPRPEPGFIGRGHTGVPLFFALSGYLITTLLLAERRATGDIALGPFWIRRGLRIFPLYYATLAGFMLALAAHEPSEATRHFAASLPFYASYTSNWFVDFDVPHPVWFAFAWSLATEEQFYLWWPIFLRFGQRLGPALVPLGLALGVGVDQLVEFGVLSRWLPQGGIAARVLASASAAMLLGAGLAWAIASPRGFAWLRRALAARHATTLCAAAAGAWLWRPFGPGILLELAFVALVGAAAAASGPASCGQAVSRRTLLNRALAARPLVYVGRVSYGMYLFHVPVLGSLLRMSPDLGQHSLGLYVATLAASLAAAAMSHRYIEGPILAVQARFRPARAPLSEVAAPLSTPPSIGWVREG